MSILDEIGDEALDLDMIVNHSKSVIMPICFLKSSPCFLNPIPSEISVSFLWTHSVSFCPPFAELLRDIKKCPLRHRKNE